MTLFDLGSRRSRLRLFYQQIQNMLCVGFEELKGWKKVSHMKMI